MLWYILWDDTGYAWDLSFHCNLQKNEAHVGVDDYDSVRYLQHRLRCAMVDQKSQIQDGHDFHFLGLLPHVPLVIRT